MKISLEKDKKRRKQVSENELKRLYYSFMLNQSNLTSESRLFYQIKLSTISRNSSITRVKNRCILTGRGRGVFRYFGLSRISLRELASKGLVPGLIKKSW